MDRIYKITNLCSYCSKKLDTRTEVWGIGAKTEYTKEDLTPKFCEDCEEIIKIKAEA